MTSEGPQFHPILSAGTQVVTLVEIGASRERAALLAGAVGVIVQSPSDSTHRYTLRFADGREAALKRKHLAVRKQFQQDPLHPFHDDRAFEEDVIYRCVIGSRAYGLEEEESDTDRRGIYLPSADRHWSLYGVPEQLEHPRTRDTYWELRKFLILALKANPNVLECLYTPLVELADPVARSILDHRSIFLSRLVYQTYNGYVMSQFKKIGQNIRNRGKIKWKHAMHLIRLLLAGVTILEEGFVPLLVDDRRDALLAIRRGEVPWEEVDRMRLDLHRRFDEAFRTTRLPERPDYDAANRLLIEARRSRVDR